MLSVSVELVKYLGGGGAGHGNIYLNARPEAGT